MADEYSEPVPTHKGTLFGVPIYLRFSQPLVEGDQYPDEAPIVWVRHWCLSPILTVMELLFGCAVFLRSMVDEDYEPMYPIKITGEYQNG